MNVNLPVTALVLSVRTLNSDTFLCALGTQVDHPVAAGFLPGQFLQLSLPGVGEIPVSYCGYPSAGGTVELCIRTVGRVTTALKAASPGAAVGLRGPFGRGFPMGLYSGQDLLLIAGGLGMAPLRSLLLELCANREQYGRVMVLLGARDAGALLFSEELLRLHECGVIGLHLAVDHVGSAYESVPGCRVALLPSLLEGLEVDSQRTYAALCGPSVVYPYLVEELQALGLPAERIHLSLERRMKCGIGRCGHCAVGCNLCCVDGPVFSLAGLVGIEGVLG